VVGVSVECLVVGVRSQVLGVRWLVGVTSCQVLGVRC